MNGKNEAGRGVRRQQSWAGVAVVLAVATALAGCGSGNSAATTATTGTASRGTAPPASTAGSGCGTSASAGSTTLHLRFAGRSRVVIVHVPAGYTGSTKVALVLNMHGSGSDASEQELFSGMDATSDGDGFIVAYPQALIAAGGGFDWNIPGVPLFGGRTRRRVRPTTLPSSPPSSRPWPPGTASIQRPASMPPVCPAAVVWRASWPATHRASSPPSRRWRPAPPEPVPGHARGPASSPSTAPPTRSTRTTATARLLDVLRAGRGAALGATRTAAGPRRIPEFRCRAIR